MESQYNSEEGKRRAEAAAKFRRGIEEAGQMQDLAVFTQGLSEHLDSVASKTVAEETEIDDSEPTIATDDMLKELEGGNEEREPHIATINMLDDDNGELPGQRKAA